jgi:hypothetical protein
MVYNIRPLPYLGESGGVDWIQHIRGGGGGGGSGGCEVWD